MIVMLSKQGVIDVDKLMNDAQCDFQYLSPILDSVARMDKKTRRFEMKLFLDEETDPEAQPIFDRQG